MLPWHSRCGTSSLSLSALRRGLACATQEPRTSLGPGEVKNSHLTKAYCSKRGQLRFGSQDVGVRLMVRRTSAVGALPALRCALTRIASHRDADCESALLAQGSYQMKPDSNNHRH